MQTDKESVLRSHALSDIFFHEHKSVKEEFHRTVGQWCSNQFK